MQIQKLLLLPGLDEMMPDDLIPWKSGEEMPRLVSIDLPLDDSLKGWKIVSKTTKQSISLKELSLVEGLSIGKELDLKNVKKICTRSNHLILARFNSITDLNSVKLCCHILRENKIVDSVDLMNTNRLNFQEGRKPPQASYRLVLSNMSFIRDGLVNQNFKIRLIFTSKNYETLELESPSLSFIPKHPSSAQKRFIPKKKSEMESEKYPRTNDSAIEVAFLTHLSGKTPTY